MRVAAWLSYNGEPFSGFARQNDQLTVQGSIEEALELLFRRPIETTCAGRTDAGVHALCQVVSFDLFDDEWFRRKPESLLKSLNALTHEAISFRLVRPMPEDFSARFSAVSREYRYYLCTDAAAPLLMEKFSWHLGKPLDVANMKEAARHLLGEHDFKSFCMAVSAKDKPTHRYVADISFKQEQIWNSNFVVMTVIGNAFLHSMVRTMVGTLVLVGLGKRTPEWVCEVLEARNRQAAGQNAPAQGLVLWNVNYDEQHFYYDPRPTQLRGELATDQRLSEAIDDIPLAAGEDPPIIARLDEAIEKADKKAAAKHKKKEAKQAAKKAAAAKGGAKSATGNAAKKAAKGSGADALWARWRSDKEKERAFVIPRGPNLDVDDTGEIPVVSEAALVPESQALPVRPEFANVPAIENAKTDESAKQADSSADAAIGPLADSAADLAASPEGVPAEVSSVSGATVLTAAGARARRRARETSFAVSE